MISFILASVRSRLRSVEGAGARVVRYNTWGRQTFCIPTRRMRIRVDLKHIARDERPQVRGGRGARGAMHNVWGVRYNAWGKKMLSEEVHLAVSLV
jgi:hypothetical protein